MLEGRDTSNEAEKSHRNQSKPETKELIGYDFFDVILPG
jgi:hypothetical protein